MGTTCDILIIWMSVHGGAYHKLLRLQDTLKEKGLSCTIVFGTEPPLGLQMGIDLNEADIPGMESRNVFLASREDARRFVSQTRTSLCIFDAHHSDLTGEMVAMARSRGIKTAQLTTLISDFSCYGADYLFMQHPMTLWYDMDYSRTRTSRDLVRAKRIFFSGNIFYEPVVNELTSSVRDRSSFFSKYGFDEGKPLCLWLPNRQDILLPLYGEIAEEARTAGCNIGVKMHPWEYKIKGLGVDVTGLKMTSAEKWGVTAIEEKDTAWAYKFCDVAISRGSSTCFELAFWNKPGLILPEAIFTSLTKVQFKLTAACSRQVDSVAELGEVLREKELPHFPEEAYAKVRQSILPHRKGDSFDWLAEDIAKALEADPGESPIGSKRRLRQLYRGKVPDFYHEALRPWQRLRFRLKKALGITA